MERTFEILPYIYSGFQKGNNKKSFQYDEDDLNE